MDVNLANKPILPQNDISLTEQKQAVLAAIIAASDDPIISKNLQGIVTSWNPAAERLFGYSEAEAIGKHISFIIPPERMDEEAFIIGQIAQGKRLEHFETERLTSDGTLITISLSVSPITTSDGTIIGASKIVRDITAAKKAKERQSILAAIIESSDDTILSKTLEGIITSWNRAAENMFGYTEAEAVGKHISLIIPPDRLQEEAFIIGEVSKGNKLDHFQTVRLAKDGRQVHISLTVSPIVDDTGLIVGASKIARDISRELAVNEEKERLYDQIKTLNNKKDEFIGMASHELKTPLTSINGYLQILSTMVTEDKAKQFVAKTRKQVSKLTALVSDLLDVSKIEAGKLQLSVEHFDICLLIKDVIEPLSLGNSNYHICLNTAVTELMVYGDPNRMEQVIINLLTNAIRYSPGTDRINIHLAHEGDNVKVGIQDYGMGIAQEKLNDIFSRFYRVEDSKSNISGLGIGLYLCKEIVLRHNGHIWAESEPGVGSTFWFTIPLEQ